MSSKAGLADVSRDTPKSTPLEKPLAVSREFMVNPPALPPSTTTASISSETPADAIVEKVSSHKFPLM